MAVLSKSFPWNKVVLKSSVLERIGFMVAATRPPLLKERLEATRPIQKGAQQ